MAEISYPFTADSATGGQQMMSQTQWQYMSQLFGKDRIDYRLTTNGLASNSLPFYARAVNTTTVSIAPGRALVGGFFYQLTETQNVTIESNTGTTGRIDLIVVRADLAKGSVNLAVKKGQPSATPAVPSITKTFGGVWEMPLHKVTVPANSGALVLTNVGPFDMADQVAVPWNVTHAGPLQQQGTFVYDMDNNVDSGQAEYFQGRDAFIRTREFGKTKTYTPALVNSTYGSIKPENRVGRWRLIAPNMYYFAIQIVNAGTVSGTISGNNFRVGVTLPFVTHPRMEQVVTGYVYNPTNTSQGLPNYYEVVADSQGSKNLYFMTPSPTSTKNGLDGLRAFPSGSTLHISGVLEGNDFNE